MLIRGPECICELCNCVCSRGRVGNLYSVIHTRLEVALSQRRGEFHRDRDAICREGV